MHYYIRAFEYVSSDLWRMTKLATRGGGSYFLAMVDYFSRRVCIHILRNKS